MAASKFLIVVDRQLQWDVFQDGEKAFVAVCEQLGLSVQASSQEQLEARAFDAVATLTKDLEEHNDAIRFLTDHGINFRVEQIQRFLS